MTKFDVYKMIREGNLEEAYTTANTLYYIEKSIPGETYHKLMDAIWEAKEDK